MDLEFSVAELTDTDLPQVVALCGEALDLPEDSAEANEIVTRLRETTAPGDATWTDGRRQLVGFVAVAGGEPVGVVLGSIAHRDPAVGHVDLIAVHPADRRRGIGRTLLSRVEGALAGLGAGEVLLAGNPPYYAWPGIDVRYTPAICAAMALGYEQDRTAWNMTADLSYDGSPALRDTGPAEARLAERGIRVRRATEDDVPALVAFARATFGGSWGGELAHSVDRPDGGCHLAVRDSGELLGFAAYGSSRPSWFGPMGTAPDTQGLGIGGVLLRRCLRDQRAAGHDRVQIGWVGPVPFYAGSAGAWIERVFFLFRKQL
ncbi:GNAT family N-acetyltransferase [Polymorphospora sp. NPDC050346]|uniref:GNAT family N-acetyltransferase n=1 Tax=Polymorphospora sp. NPDC050346 TaxID=3155780 RepID=UPI0033DD3C17